MLTLGQIIDEVLDPKGIHMPVETIAEIALEAARDCMAGDVQSGRFDLRYCIDVHNEADVLVHSKSFKDALDIVGE